MVEYCEWECVDFLADLVIDHKDSSLRDVYCVVGILRGGAIPAAVVSNILDVPVYWVEAQSYDGRVQKDLLFTNLSVPDAAVLKGKSIILVDDIWDTGKTMRIVSMWLEGRVGRDVLKVVLCTKDRVECNAQEVLWVVEASKDAWVELPWERKETV